MFARRVALSLLLCGVAAPGCVTGTTVETETQRLLDQLQHNRQSAVSCAPRELALAEASIVFSRNASAAGDALSAGRHLDLARTSAAAVLQKSIGSKCEGDRDGDGIADTVDRCPDIPEDFDGEHDEDGCPDFDRDGDGVADDRDRCPDQKEDKDGFEDQDGCPDFDNDRDGLMDVSDQCPNESEDFDGYQDLDGCPDTDNDGDDVPDVDDRCPNQPGPAATHGCTDNYKHIIFRQRQIELRTPIQFEGRNDRIKRRSNAGLAEIARAMKGDRRLRLRIEGHTDSAGTAEENLRLSEKQSKAVRRYLVSRGVGAGRLEAVGYGEDRPIDDNETPEGRAANRRIEFHLLR